MASKYYPDYAGQVPLLLKLNSKTDVPPSDEAFSPCHATVEDAVRLGADAVGYTLYVGSPKQDDDFIQLGKVRQDCDRFGMPLVIWAYPARPRHREEGGPDSLYAIDYAARVAMEMGADIVKLNMPKLDPEKDKDSPAPYNEHGGHAGRGDPPAASSRPAGRSSCCRAARRSTTTSSSSRPA